VAIDDVAGRSLSRRREKAMSTEVSRTPHWCLDTGRWISLDIAIDVGSELFEIDVREMLSTFYEL